MFFTYRFIGSVFKILNFCSFKTKQITFVRTSPPSFFSSSGPPNENIKPYGAPNVRTDGYLRSGEAQTNEFKTGGSIKTEKPGQVWLVPTSAMW